MPTNRTRTKRISKTKIPAKISKRYRLELQRRDFLGQLDSAEIPVAAKAGLLRWDLWKKAGARGRITGDVHKKGYELAPVFDGYGNPGQERYTKKTKFLISNYDELDKLS